MEQTVELLLGENYINSLESSLCSMTTTSASLRDSINPQNCDKFSKMIGTTYLPSTFKKCA